MAKKKTGSVIIKIILILFIILSLSLGVAAGYRLLKGKPADLKANSEETVKRNYVVIDETTSAPNASEEVINSASSHDVKMNSTWTFSDGKAYSKDAFVEKTKAERERIAEKKRRKEINMLKSGGYEIIQNTQKIKKWKRKARKMLQKLPPELFYEKAK